MVREGGWRQRLTVTQPAVEGQQRGNGGRWLTDVCEVVVRTRHRGGCGLWSVRLADLELQQGRTVAQRHCQTAIRSCSRGSNG
jgi:hypothetical protein